jgi:NADH-quinone oxidoreductase subunit C
MSDAGAIARAGDLVAARFPEFVVSRHRDHGDDTVLLRREGLVAVMTFLRDELDFRLPLDVTCVDRMLLGEKPVDRTPPLMPGNVTVDPCPPPGAVRERFEVVYHLRSMTRHAVVRLKVRVEEDDAVVPTVTGVFKGLNWFEREVFDMFGVRFEGHPDLRRILLYPEFQGHPLRKDYPRRAYQPRVDMPRLEGDEVPGLKR